MEETLEDAKSRAEAQAGGDWLAGMADRLGANAGASAVFGPPVEREGVTVIPVARVRWGVGGGRGRNKKQEGEGFGAGGGVQAAPLGFIEMHDGVAQYRRVQDPLRLAIAVLLLPVSFALAGVIMALTFMTMARSLRRLVSLPRLPRPFHLAHD
jgi:hypothetical protein